MTADTSFVNVYFPLAEVEPGRSGGVVGSEGLQHGDAACTAHARPPVVWSDALAAGEGAGRGGGQAPLQSDPGAEERLRGESSTLR